MGPTLTSSITDAGDNERATTGGSSSPFEPLMMVSAEAAATPSSSPTRRRSFSSKSVRLRKQQSAVRSLYGEARQRILMIALCVSALLWMRQYCGGGGGDDNDDDSSSSLPSRFRGSGGRGEGDMPPSPPLDVKLWIDSLAESLAAAKKELRKQLRKDYGMDVADNLFFGGWYDDDNNAVSKAQNVIRPADDSERGSVDAWDRISRKIAVKVLQAALLLPRTNEDASSTATITTNPTTFVWATAGHSAAAGHGNYYNQSYTAVLEQRLQPFFQHLQLKFVGRNYAVGGSSSGPEVALCLGQLYGHDDVDILSWDYGMTDGNNYERLELFVIKASQLLSRPALVAFTREESSAGRRQGVVARLAQYGMAAFVQDESEFLQQLRAHVPDTYGMTQEEIDNMSPYVKNLICLGQVEEGDPYCGDDKFDRSNCPDRRFMTSWHPGWKWHAYQGNVMAVFVVQAVEGAVTMLRNRIEAEPDVDVNVSRLVDEWVDIEREEYQHVLPNVTADDLPPYAHRFHPSPNDQSGSDDDHGSAPTENSDTDDDHGANQRLRQIYYTAPNYCHIALLPSEIRYRGILDEYPSSPSLGASSTGPVNPVNFESALVKYPWELSPEDVPAEFETESSSLPINASSKMILVGDPETRQVDCPIPLNVDHQDFFFVSQKDGWKHVDLPNRREIRSYGGLHRFHQPLRGVLAICYVGCPWDECMDYDKRWTMNDNATTNVVHLRVNGVDVTNLRAMSSRSNCHVLEHEHGYVWEPQQVRPPHPQPEATSTTDRDAAEFESIVEEGQFRVSARVSGPSSNYVRFSSFLLW